MRPYLSRAWQMTQNWGYQLLDGVKNKKSIWGVGFSQRDPFELSRLKKQGWADTRVCLQSYDFVRVHVRVRSPLKSRVRKIFHGTDSMSEPMFNKIWIFCPEMTLAQFPEFGFFVQKWRKGVKVTSILIAIHRFPRSFFLFFVSLIFQIVEA